MANPNHLSILWQGVEVWNKWREDNPDVEPDLMRANFSGANLIEADLNATNLDGADLSGASLSSADLSGASLTGADLTRTHLFGAVLKGANLRIANLRKSDLSIADLSGASLSGASLSGAKLSGANLSGATFIKAYLNGALLSGALLSGASLNKASLSGANLRGANLSNAALFKADLSGSLLSGTNLNRANLQKATLQGADLTEASLMEADLSKANLQEADMISANLTNANITGVCLFGTARDNWKIDGIKCDYIYFDSERKDRIPTDRDFRPGEFEELYRSLPTFEYYFDKGFTPIDAVIMDEEVQSINKRNPEFQIDLISFDKRGTPHATFTVRQREYIEQALQQITSAYETKIKVLEGQKDELRWILSTLSNRPSIIADTIHNINQANSIGRIEQDHGDKTDIRAEGDVAYAKDRAKADIVKGNTGSVPGDDDEAKE